MILMIHLYSDRLMQRPKTVTMDTSHGDSKSEKQIPLLSRMWGHSAESHRSMQMTRSVPLVTGAVWRFRKSSKKVSGKQIKANTHILKAPEAGQKVIMTASNAKLFFSVFPRSRLKWCTDEPCVIVRCFLCVTPQIQCLSDLCHTEQETGRLHLCLISYWLRPSSKWHTKPLDNCCPYLNKMTRYAIKGFVICQLAMSISSQLRQTFIRVHIYPPFLIGYMIVNNI